MDASTQNGMNMNADEMKTGWTSKYEFPEKEPYDMYCPQVGGASNRNNFYKKSCETKRADKNIPTCNDHCIGSGQLITYGQIQKFPKKHDQLKKLIKKQVARQTISNELLVTLNAIDRVKDDMVASGEVKRRKRTYRERMARQKQKELKEKG
jgi:hypothetical protein